MNYLTPIPKQFSDQSGTPYSYGKVYVYAAGTSELANIYKEADSDVLAENPYTLDVAGSWQCFVPVSTPLDYIVTDTDNNTVFSFKNVSVPSDEGSGASVSKAYVDTQDRALGARISNLAADVDDEVARAEAAEKAAKTEVIEGENIRVEETIAPDGHSIFSVSSDGAPQEQSNWTQQDPSEPDYIKNKPTKLSEFTDDITKQSLVESGVGIEKPVSSAAVNAGLSEKANKAANATAGNLAALDANGNLTDSGKNAADFKTKQSAVTDPTADGTGLSFIDSVTQNANGEITPHKKTVQDGSTTQKGVVQLEDSFASTSTTTAATPNAVKAAYDIAATAVQGVKVNGDELPKDGNNVVDVPVPTASTSNPLKDGTASTGSSTQWARGDHRHPTDDSREAIANKSQSIDDSSTTEYPSSKAVADFVNSSVATNTATFLGNFNLADLGLTYPATEVQIAAALNSHTWPTGYPTNNDYVYVEIRNPQSTIDDKVQRYKYRDRLASWGYEYTLNNSSFTAEEKASIDSGITSQDVTNLRADGVTLSNHVSDDSIHVTTSDKNTWDRKQSTVSTDTDSSAFSDNTTIATGFSSDKLHLNIASRLWTYIQDRISSVLGLTSNSYSGNAATASTANTANNYASGGGIANALEGKSSTSHTHSVKINGTTKTIEATGGTAVDLGTYLTSHQDISGKLDKTGNASNATSTFTKASGDASSMTSGTKLSAIFTAISSFFASLKTLAFKDKVSDSDISGTISDSHIASTSTWNGKYTKPGTGIPKTDLASAVQTSLGKADSALQGHQTVSDNNPTLAWGDTSKVGTVGSTDLRVTMPSNPASGKADKVQGATAGNLAALDANGNLTDSGKKAADFAVSSVYNETDPRCLRSFIKCEGFGTQFYRKLATAISINDGDNSSVIKLEGCVGGWSSSDTTDFSIVVRMRGTILFEACVFKRIGSGNAFNKFDFELYEENDGTYSLWMNSSAAYTKCAISAFASGGAYIVYDGNYGTPTGTLVASASQNYKVMMVTDGDGSNVSVTPDGTSTGTDIGSSTTLKVWAQKFKNLVGSLKALAFKDKVSDSDISGTISDSHIASASTWNGKQNALPTTGTASTTYAIGISGNASTASTADKVKNGSYWTITDDPAPQGLRVDGAYNNGWPSRYGNVVTVGGTGDGQLVLGWSGTTGGVAPIYYRNRRDQGGTTWSPWRTIAYQEDNGVSLSGQTLSVKINGTTQSLTNTDNTVKATAKTDNVNYKILATASASPTSGGLTEAVYDTDITLNPSTNTIAANISGNAASATTLSPTAAVANFDSFNGTVNTTNVVNSNAGSASTNPPKSDSRTFHVITTVGSNTNYQTQLAIGIDSDRHAGLFYRCREGGTWNAWMQVLNERPYSIAKGNANVGIYIDSNGHPVACSYGLSIGTAVANSSILTVL